MLSILFENERVVVSWESGPDRVNIASDYKDTKVSFRGEGGHLEALPRPLNFIKSAACLGRVVSLLSPEGPQKVAES